EAVIPGVGMNVTPMAAANNRLSAYDADATDAASANASTGRGRQGGAQAGGETAGRGGRGGGAPRNPAEAPRVVLAFPSNPDEMLLSGVLVGGQSLVNRAQVVDIPVGQGHVVSFAIRPFGRWQTQGAYFLGSTTLRDWNDLSGGKTAGRTALTQ